MRKSPSSTYRLQLRKEFDFDQAASIADYLRALGISHVYLSPCLQATTGSSSGYDVTDFKSISKELGGPEAHQRLCVAFTEMGLGQVLDIVPNHMALSQENPYWRNVLENGPDSPYASYFDLDWDGGEARLASKILLPLLGEQYGLVLKSGNLQLQRTGMRFEVVYYANRMPVAPASMSLILAAAASLAGSDRLAFLADCFARLKPQEQDGSTRIPQPQRDRRILSALLDELAATDAEIVAAIDATVEFINADPLALDQLLQQQHYRLAYWKAADQDLGYRRFFDVNSLIGMRVERANVFADTHELILDWLNRGVIDGVRVDHADGLRDPQQYFERLRRRAPDAWIVAEKILGKQEHLPAAWPIDGTTGYEFLNLVNGLLVSPQGLERLGGFYTQLLGADIDIAAMIRAKKDTVTAESLGSDVNWIAAVFLEICEADLDHRDYSRSQISVAIREVAVSFSVYRSYVSPVRDSVSEEDAAVIQSAIEAAITNRPDIDRGLFDFIADVLLLRKRGKRESDFLLRFQQFTSPVMAKGFEDTALYCFNRSIGLNDVGCSLLEPLVSIDEFHRANTLRQETFPLGMLSLSTHDTKRGEGVRARLLVLSEIPEEFAATILRWFDLNGKHRHKNLLDVNTEYFYYQTVIGAWPISEERAISYMIKAVREAKEQTSWVNNNAKFEDALQQFIRDTLSDVSFCHEVQAFVASIKHAGYINSLSQTLLKCTSPGVPDLYQGSELWDLRLVDPDNRTPVDYDQRKSMLLDLSAMTAADTMSRMDEGLPKLCLIQRALETRNRMPECFNETGSYVPVFAAGKLASHIVAFLRGEQAMTVVPRLTATVKEWGNTTITLPPGTWTDAFTEATFNGGEHNIAALISEFPVALLTKGK
jgi:(1->4)-alpha-D-glucan 1-alpha-D-glucosylmutase